MNPDTISLLISSSSTAQRCQRNWDLTKTIDDSILSCLKAVIKNSATKQNEEYYKVFFITNRELIESIYHLSYDTINYVKNPQTLAQLLILFEGRDPLTNRNLAIQHTPEELDTNQNQGVGIAAGQLVLAANMLGLKTGFCACFDKEKVSQLLNTKNPMLLVGVGYPDETKFRRANHVQSNEYAYFGSFEKPITIVTIGDSTTVETYDGTLTPQTPSLSLKLIAPSPQDIKNSVDISMIPDSITVVLSSNLYETGVKYSVDPLPYYRSWNEDCTELTLTWTNESEEHLRNFMLEAKSHFATLLSAINWKAV